MANQSTDTLVQNAACLNACIPDGLKMAVLIYIFANLAGVTTDPNTLMQASVCLNSCIPGDMKMAVLIYLASQITSTGGGGGSGATIATSNPVNTTTVAASGAFYYNKTNQTLWLNTTTGTGAPSVWQQLI